MTADDWEAEVGEAIRGFLDKMVGVGNPGIAEFRLYDDRAGKPLRSTVRGWSFFLGGLGGTGIVADDGRLYARRDWYKTHWFRKGTKMPGAAESDVERLFRYSESMHGRSGRWAIAEIRSTLARIASDHGVH